jgi:hypothetical protein
MLKQQSRKNKGKIVWQMVYVGMIARSKTEQSKNNAITTKQEKEKLSYDFVDNILRGHSFMHFFSFHC